MRFKNLQELSEEDKARRVASLRTSLLRCKKTRHLIHTSSSEIKAQPIYVESKTNKMCISGGHETSHSSMENYKAESQMQLPKSKQ
jgi:hypothetical protein